MNFYQDREMEGPLSRGKGACYKELPQVQWKAREGGSNRKLGWERESRKKISICILQIRELKLRKAKCPAQLVKDWVLNVPKIFL